MGTQILGVVFELLLEMLEVPEAVCAQITEDKWEKKLKKKNKLVGTFVHA